MICLVDYFISYEKAKEKKIRHNLARFRAIDIAIAVVISRFFMADIIVFKVGRFKHFLNFFEGVTKKYQRNIQ